MFQTAHQLLTSTYYRPLGAQVAFLLTLAVSLGLVIWIYTDKPEYPVWPKLLELGSLAFVSLWPTLTLAAHCRHQDSLLDRMRSNYAIGVAAFENGNLDEAWERLAKIRNCEIQWRLLDGPIYQLLLHTKIMLANLCGGAIAVWAIQVRHYTDNGATADAAIRRAMLFFQDGGWFLIVPALLIVMFALAPIGSLKEHNLRSRRWSEFYGDLLEGILHAGRSVLLTAPEDKSETAHEATARELLGLGERFTRAELRAAWIKLARELHPDRWNTAPERVRKLKEAALKRVNAARDELMPIAA